MTWRWMAGLVPVLVFACGGEDETTDPVAPSGCAAGEVALADGSCIRPGIPPEGCAPGFVHDGVDACNAVLPPEVCPFGLMAVPGESACRPVMACGAGQWGEIPVEPTTVYVDAAAAPGGNGSVAQPYSSIGAAVAAAGPGALVAIARGSYAGDIVISRPVRLWGVCPAEVEIVGTGAEFGAVLVGAGAGGTEIHGLGIRGPEMGFTTSGSMGVLVDRVWVHDTGSRGIDVEGVLGAASLTVTGALVEAATEIGIAVHGSTATIEGSAVRYTRSRPISASNGMGINVQLSCNSSGCDATERANATIRGSLIERNEHAGIQVMGSDATLEALAVRDNLPFASTGEGGQGIRIQLGCSGGVCNPAARANVTVRTSVIERNHDSGLFVSGSDATVAATVVRATVPQASDQTGGRGIYARLSCNDGGCDPATRANLTLTQVTLVDNRTFGLFVVGSDATVDSAVARGTLPQASDLNLGGGMVFQSCGEQPGCVPGVRSHATLRGSLSERNTGVGVAFIETDATVEDIAVRDTLPRAFDGYSGMGLSIGHSCKAIDDCTLGSSSIATVANALIERSVAIGVAVTGSEATLSGVVVRDTAANQNGLFGDGIVVISLAQPAKATVSDTRIEASARAGLSTYGAQVLLGSTIVDCAAFDLEAQDYGGLTVDLQDRGGNVCGCPANDVECKAASAGLEPPQPLEAGVP